MEGGDNGKRKWGPMINTEKLPTTAFPGRLSEEKQTSILFKFLFLFSSYIRQQSLLIDNITTFTFLDKTVKKLGFVKIVLKYITWEEQVSFKVESIKDHNILGHSLGSCVRYYF